MKKLHNYNPIKNLGKFAHKAKMPSGGKIGAGTVKKSTRRKIKQTMKTPKV